MRVRILTPAARILLALARANRPLGFGEIKNITGLHHASVDLNLKRLMIEGFVAKQGRFYVLTPKGKAKLERLIAELGG